MEMTEHSNSIRKSRNKLSDQEAIKLGSDQVSNTTHTHSHTPASLRVSDQVQGINCDRLSYLLSQWLGVG